MYIFVGRLLEPISSEEHLSRPDARFPAEIVLRVEAKQEYEIWRDSIGNEMRRIKLEEEAEKFLSSCHQVDGTNGMVRWIVRPFRSHPAVLLERLKCYWLVRIVFLMPLLHLNWQLSMIDSRWEI